MSFPTADAYFDSARCPRFPPIRQYNPVSSTRQFTPLALGLRPASIPGSPPSKTFGTDPQIPGPAQGRRIATVTQQARYAARRSDSGESRNLFASHEYFQKVFNSGQTLFPVLDDSIECAITDALRGETPSDRNGGCLSIPHIGPIQWLTLTEGTGSYTGSFRQVGNFRIASFPSRASWGCRPEIS